MFSSLSSARHLSCGRSSASCSEYLASEQPPLWIPSDEWAENAPKSGRDGIHILSAIRSPPLREKKFTVFPRKSAVRRSSRRMVRDGSPYGISCDALLERAGKGCLPLTQTSSAHRDRASPDSPDESKKDVRNPSSESDGGAAVHKHAHGFERGLFRYCTSGLISGPSL